MHLAGITVLHNCCYPNWVNILTIPHHSDSTFWQLESRDQLVVEDESVILVCQVKCHHPLCQIFKFWLSSLHRHAGQISVRLRPLRTGIQTGLCKLPGHFLQNTPFYIYIYIYIGGSPAYVFFTPCFPSFVYKNQFFLRVFYGLRKKGKSEIHILWISRILPKNKKS